MSTGPGLCASRWDPHPEHVDPVAVDRFVTGRDPGRPLTPAERAAAARIMLARGVTANQICLRIETRADRLEQLLTTYPERSTR